MADREELEDEKKDFIANPPELDGVCDLSQLIYLEMPNVVHNLEYRYMKMKPKRCYTSISSILLAINPYESLPIYGNDVIEHFKRAADKNSLPTDRPHPYGVSARAYLRLVQRKKNQSVVVCGESGAGKTETTKKLLKYLAVTAPSSMIDSKTIEDQIVAASPILEAFGNAKTVMNNNSSRFGKFTKLLYSVPENEDKTKRSGSILGSYLETYLLEKSRVVFQAANERNYHIFYFLHQGFESDTQKKSELCLDQISTFEYINQGKVTETFHDLDDFTELTESLEKFRINRDEQHVLWQITSGILNLGNIVFTREDSGYASVDTSKCNAYVNAVAKLWDIKSDALIKRLTTASVVINRKTIIKQINFEDANANRDSIAKGIYENVFLWLCERINEELYLDEAKGEGLSAQNELKFIGILDVFGFENFWDNSMEQFCINYTNEKLQQYFNYHIIMSEQEEYLKESVLWTPLKIPDNAPYLNLVEDKKSGFFTLLDSQCRGPAKDDTEAFMQQIFKKHGDNETIVKANKQGAGSWRGTRVKRKGKGRRSSRGSNKMAKFSGFIIIHYADKVCYNVAEFLKKNAESVHSDTFKMIKKSSRSILQQIKQAKSKRKKTVTSVFHRGIKTLMKNLDKTEPYFVRCINPNKIKSHKDWTEDIVRHQLRCGGLLEALKVLKLGYPTRVPYQTLYEKYHSSVDNPLIKNMNEAAFSTSLLIAFDVNESDYELGLTKIFFKPAKAAILDTIMSKAGEPLTEQQNDKITRYIVGKRIRQLIGATRAFVALRQRVRKARAQLAWEHAGCVASLLGATVCKQLYVIRKEIEDRNKRNGALGIQNMFRGYVEKMAYCKRIGKVRQSVETIWNAYRTMQQRACLDQWFMEKAAERAQIRAQKLAEEEEEKKAADLAAKEAAKLLSVAAEAKKKRIKFAVSPRSKEDEEKEKEMKEMEALSLRNQIEEKSRKQYAASALLKRTKTKAKLKLKEEKRLLRVQTVEQGLEEREEMDKLLSVRAEILEEEDEEEGSSSVSSFDEDDKDEEDEWSSSDEDFDITELLDNFEQISRLGAKFSRHAGKRMHKKPQLRTVKVSFSEDGAPLTLSWGAGSRAIKVKDIWYVAWGHCTPTFLARKDKLEPMKCLSIVGHSEKQVLDLEAYTKRDAKIWVKGLRKLINQSDEKADDLANMNLQRLMQYAKQQQEAKKKLKTKQLRVVKMQQDLFVMTVEAVYKELEEQKIWRMDDEVRKHFAAAAMYEAVLKQDIPWRKWQWFVREQITNYLRENNMVLGATNATAVTRTRSNNAATNDDDEVTLFLKHYKLHKYDGALRDAGLDSLDELRGLKDAQDVAAIAQEVSMARLHENKFVGAWKDLHNKTYPPQDMKEVNAVDEWLDKYGLAKYKKILKTNGFTELKDVKQLNQNDANTLADECGMGVLHKKKFVAACNECKRRIITASSPRSPPPAVPTHEKKKSDCAFM
eukprot:179682_1